MPIATASDPLCEETDFDVLYQVLADAWWTHQRLRETNAPISDLAASNAHLFRTRMAMGCLLRDRGS